MKRRQLLPLLLILALAALSLPRNSAAEGKAGVIAGGPGSSDIVIATLGDYVWNDQDGDGRQDEGPNAGLNGVEVRLYRDDGDELFEAGEGDAQVATTVTTSGFYNFDLESVGAYWVEVDPAVITSRGYSIHAGSQSRVSPHLISVSEGAIEQDVDFGYVLRGAISGVVFADADQNGEQDLTEPGMADVELRLYSDASGNGSIDAGDVLLARAFTEVDGAFIFHHLLPSDYILVTTTPAGAQATTPVLRPVHLITGEVAGASYDFGNYQAGGLRLFAPRIRG